MDERIKDIVARAGSQGRALLLESEGFEVLSAIGIGSPRAQTIQRPDDIAALDLSRFPGDRLMLKVVSSTIAHKSELGGVCVVERRQKALQQALVAMQQRLAGHSLAGFSVQEFVPEATQFGREALLGIRWSDEFGPVLAFGPGGIFAEVLARHWMPGRGVIFLCCDELLDRDAIDAMRDSPWISLLTEPFRGRAPIIAWPTLAALLERVGRLAADAMPEVIAELEVNPLVFCQDGPMALDVLIRPGLATTSLPGADKAPGGSVSARAPAPDRPIHKIERLLEPRSIAVIGVSQDESRPGHILLRNLLNFGVHADAVRIVKKGVDLIEGCRCVADIASLPVAVDLAVVCVGSAQAQTVVLELIRRRKAESILLIAGGADPRNGQIGTELVAARSGAGQGPVLNGGNSVGIRSIPGRLDALFIPRHKFRGPTSESEPVALLSQSGALLITLLDRWSGNSPRYAISLGNQLDLSVSDYLEYFARKGDVDIVAVYLEGFQPLDGRRFLRATRELTRAGRTVMIYRAGRTPAGALASASHTASVAGDYRVSFDLCARAGAIVIDSLDDFHDMLALCAHLRQRPVRGPGLGVLSNAGFECVAIADRLSSLNLVQFSPSTCQTLVSLLRDQGIAELVDLRNPLDVSPMLSDARFAEAVGAIVDDPGVHVAIIGCVPMTSALQTRLAHPSHGEDLESPDSVVERLIRLHRSSKKPWLVVVDGSEQYDPMRKHLRAAGIPTFQTADRAAFLLQELLPVLYRPVRGPTS